MTTLLGRAVYARADTDGAIAVADAALAVQPGNIDLVLAAARARDVALQFHRAIEVYTRGSGDKTRACDLLKRLAAEVDLSRGACG